MVLVEKTRLSEQYFSAVQRSTGRTERTPSGGGVRLGCGTRRSWLRSSGSPGSAGSKLWPCCSSSPASSSSATRPPQTWSPSWVRLPLSKSTASSTSPPLETEGRTGRSGFKADTFTHNFLFYLLTVG
ncbi:hypothetical protein FQN60_014364 [Etheostoma spectabile]|uniref:Uncharacterized protein n=1 Tax=Etheostoma spectabile TaxID=54343 RepID=A0A5J5DBR3_9PERO|nr:hypothetical protein FQN60_014364 [Etheostoma spectabile]